MSVRYFGGNAVADICTDLQHPPKISVKMAAQSDIAASVRACMLMDVKERVYAD